MNDNYQPLPIETKLKAITCSCGEFRSSITSEDGSTYVWGKLAGDGYTENQFTPRLLQNNLFVKKVSLGEKFFFLHFFFLHFFLHFFFSLFYLKFFFCFFFLFIKKEVHIVCLLWINI